MKSTVPFLNTTSHPCTWLTDRLPLTQRVTGRYVSIWALHAEGHHDDAVAAQLNLSPSTVRAAVRSIYRALAIDPGDGHIARVQARQLYQVFMSIRTGQSAEPS